MKTIRFKYFLTISIFLGFGWINESFGATQKEKYVYESPLNVGLDLQGYKVKYTNYLWSSTEKSEKEGYGFNLGLEWIPVVSVVGKVATSFGIGFSSVVDVPVGGVSTATLYVVPMYGGVTYRADLFKNQVLVPFVSAGLDFGFSTQTSKNGATQGGLRTYEGYYYSGGVELCLNTFDPASGRDLDSRIGINGVYLVALYTHSEPLSNSETVNLAHKEFRLGLRFEI
jgi:hypothetical protein